MNIPEIARLLTEDPDLLNEFEGEEPKPLALQAAEKVADIWDQYAKINPHASEVEMDYEDEDHLMIYLAHVGAKWEGLSQNDAKRGGILAAVGADIADYVNEKTGSDLTYGWEYDRGGGVFSVGVDVEDMGHIEDAYEAELQIAQEFDDDPHEAQFMSGIHESVAGALDYEDLIPRVASMDPQEAQQLATAYPRPFVKSVVNILKPSYDDREGRYGAVATSDPPSWASKRFGMGKIAERLGGETVTIRLQDAEAEFPLELHQSLTEPSHKEPGRQVAWASGFVFPDKGLLAVIEIQSDVARKAVSMLESDPQFGKLKQAVVSGFDDWNEALLKVLVRYAISNGLSRIKLPTARRLGRFWRGVGEKPNMKFLKSLYDRNLRDYARKEGDWWVIDVGT